MKRLISAAAIVALAFTFGIGMSVVEARITGGPTTFKCFNQDTYRCSLAWDDGYMFETCTYYAMGCETSSDWYCVSGGPYVFACPSRTFDPDDCIWHPFSCP